MKSLKHGGQGGNVASKRSDLFREIPDFVEAETILRRVSIEGTLGWNVRYSFVQVHKLARRLERVRKNPVAELLIASPRTPMRVERNIPVRESAGREQS